MRVEETATALVIESESGWVVKAFASLFACMVPVYVLILASALLSGPRMRTIDCDRARATCVASLNHGRDITLPLAEVASIEAVHERGNRNKSSFTWLRAKLKDGKTVALSEDSFRDESGAAVRKSAAEVQAFLADPAAATLQTTYPNGDTDWAALIPLGISCAVGAWIFLRLWRRVRVDIDKVARTVRIQTKERTKKASDVTIGFGEVTKVIAWSTGRRGWASLYLARRSEPDVAILTLPRMGNARTQMNELLPKVAAIIGVGTEQNDGYRAAWA